MYLLYHFKFGVKLILRMASKAVIKVSDLRKNFAKTKAVQGISFSVAKGSITAFLGPNGAGKTTTLEMLEGLLKPSGGTIEVLGFNPVKKPDEVKRRIGIQLQTANYYQFLRLKELLVLFASFYNRKVDADKLLNIVGLADKKNAYVDQLSGGQKQRFSIVSTLVNDPQIIFLDEPTTGLDPQARRNLWEIIAEIKRQGKTIILTTHYMEEAQYLADKIFIIDKGKIVAQGTTKQLIAQLPNPYRIEITSAKKIKLEKLRALSGVISGTVATNTTGEYEYSLGTKNIHQTLPAVVKYLEKEKIAFEDIAVAPSNLEDVFLTLTGKELRD